MGEAEVVGGGVGFTIDLRAFSVREWLSARFSGVFEIIWIFVDYFVPYTNSRQVVRIRMWTRSKIGKHWKYESVYTCIQKCIEWFSASVYGPRSTPFCRYAVKRGLRVYYVKKKDEKG